MGIRFEIIDTSSPFYEESLALRSLILRKPLGLNYTEQDFISDQLDLHLILINNGEVEAVLLLKKISKSIVKMRQVAVSEINQNKGFGTKLVKWSEKIAKEKGYKTIELNARKVAIPFYLRLNYNIEGGEFTEVGIPHKKMYKHIN